MRKTGTAISILLAALLLTGCVGTPGKEQRGGADSSTPGIEQSGGTPETEQITGGGVRETFAGVVTDRFTEGGGADSAEVLAVELDSGEIVHLTLLEGTVLQNGDVAAGDRVEVESESGSDSGYHPALTVTKVKEPLEVSSSAAPYARIRLTVPEGWVADEKGFDLEREPAGEFGIVFWPEDAPELQVSLCYYDGFGLCGTGVTVEDITLPGGQEATTYTDSVSFILCYRNVPGDYVASYYGSRALWEQYEDEVLSILGKAALGVEGVLPESEAVQRVKGRCSFAYEGAYGRFDAASGVWKVTFYGGNESETFQVNADGTVEDLVESVIVD